MGNGAAVHRVVFSQPNEILAWAQRSSDMFAEARQMMERFAEARQMMERFAESHRTYLASFPPNIRDVRELWLSNLVDCAADGIPIWHVPRTEVIDALMEASSSEERYAVVDRFREEIIDDCRTQIELLDSVDRSILSEIAGALESGFWHAAQALAMNVVEWKLPDRSSAEGELIRLGEAVDNILERDPKELFVCIALNSAFRKFRPERGDPIPTSPNRHATVHLASSHQYTPTNALLGLMLATCAARFGAIVRPEG